VWIFVESASKKRGHSGIMASFYNAAIGEKIRVFERAFLDASSGDTMDSGHGER